MVKNIVILIHSLGGFTYGDDKRIISISVYKDFDGEPFECYYNFFDKNEKFKNSSKYKVTSWDEVIEHFIFDEIELKRQNRSLQK